MNFSLVIPILSLICFISACSTPLQDSSPPGAVDATQWSANVKTNDGYLHINGTLKARDTTSIEFGKDKYGTNIVPLTIQLSDEDCEVGHKAKIRYHADKYNILYKYSEKEIPWNTFYDLEVRWGNGDLRITLNGELLQIKQVQPFKHIKISSSQPVKIENPGDFTNAKLTTE